MSTLYRKYRPKKFSEVSGQTHIIRTLTGAVKNGRVGHAYLFTGPRGTGKTTISRLFAKLVNCQSPSNSNVKSESSNVAIEPCNKCDSCKLILDDKAIDIIEIDAASHTGVDNIRSLKQAIPLPPTALKYKVYIIDEVHMLSAGAFNALLKTLEEPPAHAIFILATTELHKVPETIISRCQRFDISRLTQSQIVDRLRQLAKTEKVKIDEGALEVIAIEAEGGMRDAESLLDQIIALEDSKITTQEVNQILGTSSKEVVIEFAQKIIDNDVAACLEHIEKLEQEGVNLKNFNKLLLSFLRDLLKLILSSAQTKEQTTALTKQQLEKAATLVSQISAPNIVVLIELFQKSLEDFKQTAIPQLPLEMACVEYHLSITDNSHPAGGQPQADKQTTEVRPQTTDHRPQSKVQKKIENESKENQKSSETKQSSQKEIKNTSEKDTENKPIKNIKLESVLDKWSEILEGVKPHNHSIHAFLKNCTPCGTKEGTVYIKTKYDFYKDKLSEMNNRLTVQKVVGTIFDAVVKVTFVTEKECAGLDFGEKEEKSEKKNVLHDAMQVLGGRIVSD